MKVEDEAEKLSCIPGGMAPTTLPGAPMGWPLADVTETPPAAPGAYCGWGWVIRREAGVEERLLSSSEMWKTKLGTE
jgi:hypothetical protein